MSKIRVDELINQSNSGPTLAVEGLRVPSTKSLVVEGIISLNGDTGLTGQVLSRTGTGVGWANVPLTDNNTTYTLSTIDGADPNKEKVIRLSAGGSGSGFTDIVLVAGNNVSLTRNSGRITIDSAFTNTDTVTRLGANGQNYTDGDINLIGTGAATIIQSGRTFTINVNDDDTTYTGESGVTVTADNKIKIGQPVGPTDPVTFQQVTVSGNLIVQGTTTTSNTVTVTTLDKFINLNDVLIPTDAVADGGGIRLKGDSPHTILWSNTEDSWNSSENFNLASGRNYLIDGDEVITGNALGNAIRASSLESVGVLSAGRWEAQTIGIAYGGTGHTNANDALNELLPAQAANGSKYLTTDGQNTSWGAIPPTYNGWSIGDNSVTAQVNSNDVIRIVGTGSALVTMDNVQKRLTINADNTTYNLTVENEQEPNRRSIRLTDNTGNFEEVILSAGTGVTLTRTGRRLEFSVAQDLSSSAIPTFTGLDITGNINASTYTGSAAQLENLTGVPNGVYGSSAVIPVISIDPSGRITDISTAPNTGAAGAGGIVAGGNDYSIQYNNNGGFAGSDKIKFEPIQGELKLEGYLTSDNIVSHGATITELQALDYIKFPSKTISERDYLNVLNGSVIYNNANDRLEMYQDGEWIPIGGITQIGDLLDVSAGHPTDGQVLSFSSNGNRWVPTTIAGGSGGGLQQNNPLVVINETIPSGSGSLFFNSAQNVLRYTPPDITSFISTETDPIFSSSPAANITNINISNWNSAYNWGDHSTVGYLQATNSEKANWNLAYNWGNHASAGYITAEVDTLDSVTGRGNTTINGITVGQLTAGGLTYPNVNGTSGQILTSDGSGNVTWQNAPSGGGGSATQSLDQVLSVGNTTTRDIITTGKILYSNNYANLGDLPSPSTYHGMFAHVHGEGHGYYSHAGAWVQLLDTSSSINELSDVTTGTISTGDVLTWSGSAWAATAPSATFSISDVDNHLNVSTASSGQVLSWNGSDYAWVTSGGAAATTLGGLSDVDVTGASVGSVIKYNGTSWEVASDLTGGAGGANVTISDDPPTNPSSGDLWWESDKGRLKIRYSSVWVDANPVGGGGSGSGSSTSIISPVAYAVVGTNSAGSGTNMSWGAYDSSTGQIVFTFDTAQPDANYYVHTNREHFATHNIEVLSKSTTGFTTKWTNSDTSLLPPGTFKGVLIVYASTPTISVGGGSGGGGTSYANSDVDSHLNRGSATANQVLSWNGSDYAWVAQTTDTDTTYTAGTGVTLTGTSFSIGQDIATNSSPTFAGLTLNGTFLPFTDGTFDLGSTTKKWRYLYVDNLVAGGLTYPTSNGTTGQVLTSNGSGGVTWTTVSGGGGGGGIALTNLSVTTATAGTAALAYNNTNGVFTYTPPDLSGYSTFSGSYADLTNKPTIPSTLNDLTDVDAVTGAANGKILKYNGSSWELADDLTGGGGSGTTINNNADNRVITGSNSANTLEAESTLTYDGSQLTAPYFKASNGAYYGAMYVTLFHAATETKIYSGGSSYSDHIFESMQGSNPTRENFRIGSSGQIGLGGGGTQNYGTSGQVLTSNGPGSAASWTTISGGGGGSSEPEITWTLGAIGSSHYTFTGSGFTGAVSDPTLYLVRGQTYKFDNQSGGHPFRIQSTAGISGTPYTTGVTNSPANTGSALTFIVPMDAPDTLYYQCTSHPAMNGTINVLTQGSGGIALTDLSVSTASAGSPALSYNNGTGVFTYTPPDLSGYASNTNVSNWDTAYSWGDHSQAGYLTSASGTNLGGSRTTTQMIITSSTGGDVTFGPVTTTLAGPMSAADKSKLDGIASGATNTAAPYYTSAISVGDGGLTQRNFTTALKNKLDGIATGATSYSSNQATNTNSSVTFGSVYSSGNVTAYSDVSLKENINTISDALSKVTKLRGVSYDRKDTKQKGIGVIAQEIEKVLPEVVETTEYKSVAYGNIVGVLIEAIKELKTEVDDLKKQLRGNQ